MIRESTQEAFTVSAPGSFCLLGEELASLGLRTVHIAINLRVYVKAETRTDGLFRIERTDKGEPTEFIPLEKMGTDQTYGLSPLFPLRRAIDLLGREGMSFDKGCTFRIAGDMPPDSGLGYPAALMVAWVTALLQLHGRHGAYSAQKIAALAREAALIDEDEPPELVDHVLSAVGGIHQVDHGRDCALAAVTRALDGLIIAEVEETGTDRRSGLSPSFPSDMGPVRALAAEADRALREVSPPVDLRTSDADEVFAALKDLPDRLAKAAYAAVVDRDISDKAYELLIAERFDQDAFGEMIDTHHEMLRDNLGIVVPQVERAIEVCKDAKALGCKINPAKGATRGRTLTVYAPGRALQVAAALRDAAIWPRPVTKTHGVCFED